MNGGTLTFVVAALHFSFFILARPFVHKEALHFNFYLETIHSKSTRVRASPSGNIKMVHCYSL